MSPILATPDPLLGWWLLPALITLLVVAALVVYAVNETRDDDEAGVRFWPMLALVAAFPLSLLWLIYFAACTAAGRTL